MGLGGLLAVVGGIVVVLRRREYRALRSRYAEPGLLEGEEKSP